MIVNGIEVRDTKDVPTSFYDREFKAWASGKDYPFFDKLSDVIENPKVELQKGQKCAVINGYKLLLHGFTIMGFSKPDEYGQCVYLNWDCYWFPVKPEEIVLE